MATRPKAFGLGPFRASVLRGPKDERWYWRVRHTSAGVEDNRWTGWATLEEAQQVVADLVREGESKGAVPKTDTVLDLLEYWLGAQEDRVDLRPATIESCRQAVKRFKLGTLAGVRVDRVDRRTLETWRDATLRSGRASRTVELDLLKLGQAWRWGRETGLIDAPELPHIRLKVRPTRDDYTPTPGEVATVVKDLRKTLRIDKAGRPHRGMVHNHALAVEVLAATGARRGEIENLTAADLTPIQQGVIVALDGKANPREVPVLNPLAGRLLAYAQDRTGPLFGGVTGMDALEKILAAACARHGIQHFSIQGLRRLYVDRLYDSNVDPGTAANLAGHSAKVALEHYRRSKPKNRLEAVIQADLSNLPAGDVIDIKTREKS